MAGGWEGKVGAHDAVALDALRGSTAQQETTDARAASTDEQPTREKEEKRRIRECVASRLRLVRVPRARLARLSIVWIVPQRGSAVTLSPRSCPSPE